MAFKLRVARDPLSDGSDVYAVVLSDADGAYLVIDATSSLNAHALAEDIRDALKKYTNEDVMIG
jgi:hypothetical protein